MNYPNGAGYQKHSETSQDAANDLQSAKGMRDQVVKYIKHSNTSGMTCDEIFGFFDQSIDNRVAPGTISARLIELERDGSIIKSNIKRKTRHNRNAFVYVAKAYWTEAMGKAPTPVSKASKLSEADKAAITLGKTLFMKIKFSLDGGATIYLDSMDLAVVENLARQGGISHG